jgi:predicted RNase H-like HicB family nuclease
MDSIMKSSYIAITRQDGKWWIGWIEEIPGVNAQEPTREKLMASRREILVEALEFNRRSRWFLWATFRTVRDFVFQREIP